MRITTRGRTPVTVEDSPLVKFYSIERVRFPRLRVLAEAIVEVFTLWREKFFSARRGES